MKITENKLRNVVKRALSESYSYDVRYNRIEPIKMNWDTNRLIGECDSFIGQDSRTSELFKVWYHPQTDTVTIELTERSAQGGYDGMGGSTPPVVSGLWTSEPGVKGTVVARNLRGMIAQLGDITRGWGKPSKNFKWHTGYGERPIKGMSAKVVSERLAAHRR
mgnify:FL=1